MTLGTPEPSRAEDELAVEENALTSAISVDAAAALEAPQAAKPIAPAVAISPMPVT